MSPRLERSSTDRVLSGVAGGMAEYFAVSPGFVRVLFVLAAIFSGGIFVIVYVALIVILPVAPAVPAGDGSVAAVPRPPLDPAEADARAQRRREAVGYLLVALGAIFLLGNVGLYRFIEWRYIWPLALIALGVFLIVQRVKR